METDPTEQAMFHTSYGQGLLRVALQATVETHSQPVFTTWMDTRASVPRNLLSTVFHPSNYRLPKSLARLWETTAEFRRPLVIGRAFSRVIAYVRGSYGVDMIGCFLAFSGSLVALPCKMLIKDVAFCAV